MVAVPSSALRWRAASWETWRASRARSASLGAGRAWERADQKRGRREGAGREQGVTRREDALLQVKVSDGVVCRVRKKRRRSARWRTTSRTGDEVGSWLSEGESTLGVRRMEEAKEKSRESNRSISCSFIFTRALASSLDLDARNKYRIVRVCDDAKVSYLVPPSAWQAARQQMPDSVQRSRMMRGDQSGRDQPSEAQQGVENGGRSILAFRLIGVDSPAWRESPRASMTRHAWGPRFSEGRGY